MSNFEIRSYAMEKGVKNWQIAKALRMHEGTFSRKLRSELPCDEKTRIMDITDKLSGLEEIQEARQRILSGMFLKTPMMGEKYAELYRRVGMTQLRALIMGLRKEGYKVHSNGK